MVYPQISGRTYELEKMKKKDLVGYGRLTLEVEVSIQGQFMPSETSGNQHVFRGVCGREKA